MEYFISIAGDRTGPHSQFQIIEKIRDGGLKGEELAWRKGADEWKPLRDFEEFASYWQPTPQQVATAEQVRQVARIALDTPQPWLRFWARMMDYVWFSMLLGMLLERASSPGNPWCGCSEALTTATPGRALLIMTLLNTGTFRALHPAGGALALAPGNHPGQGAAAHPGPPHGRIAAGLLPGAAALRARLCEGRGALPPDRSRSS